MPVQGMSGFLLAWFYEARFYLCLPALAADSRQSPAPGSLHSMASEKPAPSAPRTPLNSVLVIGGCGFLGHHVVRLLQEYHPEASVSVLDLRTSVNRFSGVSYHDGDVTSRESVDGVLAATKPECVIDTVSPVHGLGSEIYYKVNVDGTRVCLDAAADAGVKVCCERIKHVHQS